MVRVRVVQTFGVGEIHLLSAWTCSSKLQTIKLLSLLIWFTSFCPLLTSYALRPTLYLLPPRSPITPRSFKSLNHVNIESYKHQTMNRGIQTSNQKIKRRYHTNIETVPIEARMELLAEIEALKPRDAGANVDDSEVRVRV